MRYMAAVGLAEGFQADDSSLSYTKCNCKDHDASGTKPKVELKSHVGEIARPKWKIMLMDGRISDRLFCKIYPCKKAPYRLYYKRTEYQAKCRKYGCAVTEGVKLSGVPKGMRTALGATLEKPGSSSGAEGANALA